MKQTEKCTVLIHGLSLGARDWEYIEWGNPPETLGRISRGVMLAYTQNADLLYWGSGVSWKGKMDSDAAYELALTRVNELAELCGTDKQTMNAFIVERSFLDHESQDTRGEIQCASELCIKRNIEKLILISSPTHIARCLLTALVLCEENPHCMPLRRNLQIASSDVPYAGTKASDVVIFEPPHRGDVPSRPIHLLAKASVGFITARAFNEQFVEDWKELLKSYGANV